MVACKFINEPIFKKLELSEWDKTAQVTRIFGTYTDPQYYVSAYGHFILNNDEFDFDIPDFNKIQDLIYQDYADKLLQLYVKGEINRKKMVYSPFFDNFVQQKSYFLYGSEENSIKKDIFKLFLHKKNNGLEEFLKKYINDNLNKYCSNISIKPIEDIQDVVGFESPFVYITIANILTPGTYEIDKISRPVEIGGICPNLDKNSVLIFYKLVR